MPPGLIEHEGGMGPRRHLAADLGQMHAHRLTVAMGHDEPSAFPFSRTDGANDPGRCPTQIAGRYWSGSAFGPAPGEFGLLADPGLVLPPQLYRRTFGRGFADLRQTGGELFFKMAISARSCA